MPIYSKKFLCLCRRQLSNRSHYSRKEAAWYWSQLGGTVASGIDDGHWVFAHRRFPTPYLCGRKKDCPRKLEQLIRSLMEEAILSS